MLIKLGEVIKTYRRKCGISNLTVNDIHGIDINKQFFSPTKQVGKNTSNYLIVPINFFACNLMHVGRDGSIPLALNKFQKDIIVSRAYFIFENIRKDIILDDFLFLYLSRPEFDRLSTFNTDSSVRDGLSWDRFIDVNIEVPSIEIQQKYVDVYNALVANQKAYENGLADLRLISHSYIESLKEKCDKVKIGSFTRERNEKNSNDIKNVLGISKNGFIKPKTKPSDNLSNYNVFYKGDFVFSPPRINIGSIGLYSKDKMAICSPIYKVFYVDKPELVMPEYLNLWLSRDEFYRYTDFMSIASVRNNFDYDLMSEIEIPVPSLKIQKAIVDISNLYNIRKSLSESLSSLAKILCPVLIKGAIQES